MKQAIPGKDEIALMPPFAGLALEHVRVPASAAEFAEACAAIMSAGVVGFDTESKPTFAVGEISDGPHVVQFALHHCAYLFQVHRAEGRACLLDLLRSETLIKVGFGLQSDRGHIQRKFGIEFGGVADLNSVFSMRGYQRELGVKNAVALVFGQRFSKSKKVTTTDWSRHELSAQQMLYAANDAYAALKVFEALELPHVELPIMGRPLPEPGADKT